MPVMQKDVPQVVTRSIHHIEAPPGFRSVMLPVMGNPITQLRERTDVLVEVAVQHLIHIVKHQPWRANMGTPDIDLIYLVVAGSLNITLVSALAEAAGEVVMKAVLDSYTPSLTTPPHHEVTAIRMQSIQWKTTREVMKRNAVGGSKFDITRNIMDKRKIGFDFDF